MNRTTLSTLAETQPPEPLPETIFTNNRDGWTATPWRTGFMQKPRYWERSSLAAPEAPDRFASCRCPRSRNLAGILIPKCKRWHCFIVPRPGSGNP